MLPPSAKRRGSRVFSSSGYKSTLRTGLQTVQSRLNSATGVTNTRLFRPAQRVERLHALPLQVGAVARVPEDFQGPHHPHR
jgi:hypothetical protein